MRDDEPSFGRLEVDRLVVVENEVEIDDAGSVTEGDGPADGGFDPLEQAKDLERGERGRNLTTQADKNLVSLGEKADRAIERCDLPCTLR